MVQGREHDQFIIGARFTALLRGIRTNFPNDVTETERFEWPLVAERRGTQWYPRSDAGSRLFQATPPVPTGEGALPVAPQRVVVCGTTAQLAELFPRDRSGVRLRQLVAEFSGVADPLFARCPALVHFWTAWFGCRWYLDPEFGPTLPALLVTTGEMHDRPSADVTHMVEQRLREIADLYGVRFAKVTV